MKDILKLIGSLTWYATGFFFVGSSLNAIFGWQIGLKTPGSSSEALPSDWGTIIILTVILLILGLIFYAIGDFKQVWKFTQRYRWPLLGGLVLLTALSVVGISQSGHNHKLTAAVQNGNSAEAQSLLQTRNYSKETLTPLLYRSIQSEDYELAEMLLEQGADIDYSDEYTSHLLSRAVQSFPVSATDFLLSHGVDVNFVDEHNQNALHDLLKYRADFAEADEAEILLLTQKLVAADIDTTLTSEFDATPLSIAQDKGYKDVAEYLEQL